MSWLAANKVATMLLSFGSMMILARLLSPADFGVMAAAMLVVALASAIFEGAFGINLLRRAQLDDRSVATTFWLSVVVGLTTFLVIAAFSPAVEAFFSFDNLAWVLLVAGSSIIFKSFGAVSQSLLQRRGQFRLLSITNILSYAAGNTICSIALAVQGYGVWSLVIGGTLTVVLESLANLYCAKVPVFIAPSRAAASEVFRLSGWFALSQVLNWAATAGANAVTGRTLGAEALGIYSRGWKLIDIIVGATAQPMQRVLLPSFARKQGDLHDVNRAFLKALEVAVIGFAAISAFAMIHAEAIVLVALGSQWTATVPVVQLLFAALLPRCCYKISEAVAYACGSSLGATVRQAVYAVMIVGGAIIASPMGPTAVAAAVFVALWCFYIVSLGYVLSITRGSASLLIAIHFRALVLVLPAALVDLALLLLSPFSFWPGHLAGGLVGLAVLGLTIIIAPRSLLGDALSGIRASAELKSRQFRNVAAKRQI
ncbi:oligosaccharide flippase family protein [Croceibacterium ferulae]|uniref:oligosaccharide flippase family protein n=1 Tax=Croceibacterium ferulae TaxID=1854641 RepID=UPI00138FC76F|nr:oligosaccharide flippase family protein [Croceibacterium ferulae]